MSLKTNGSNTNGSNITPADLLTESGRLTYLVKGLLAKVRTSMPVQVLTVTNNGGVSPIGYVDIQPLVNLMDGSGNVMEHAPVYNVPYLRIQGGSNAVILDPQAGDIGMAVFADRDISTVKFSKATAAPASTRKHNISDAVYLGTVIGVAPTQYIQFNESGITILSPNAVTINAQQAQVTAPTVTLNATTAINMTTPTLTLNGNLALNGSITQTGSSGGAAGTFSGSIAVSGGDVSADGVSLKTHIHGGVEGGSDNTGVPV